MLRIRQHVRVMRKTKQWYLTAGLRANDRVGHTVLRQQPSSRPPIFVNYCLYFELMFFSSSFIYFLLGISVLFCNNYCK
jgi:hypothetical protein